MFRTLLVFQTLLFLCLPFFGRTIIESLLMYGAWGSMLLLIIVKVSENSNRIVLKSAVLLFALLGSVICSIIVSDYKSSGTLVASLNYIVSFSPFFCSKYISTRKTNRKFLRIIALLQAMIMLFLSFTSKAYAPYYVDLFLINDGELTLGYSNPNLTGVILFYVFILLFSNLKDERRKYQRLAYSLLIAYIGYLIMRTGCRIMIIAIFIMIAFLFFSNQTWIRKILISRMVMLGCILSSVAFLFVFYYLYQKMPTLTVMGGNIYSRITIFDRGFDAFYGNYLFGNLPQYLFENLHNGALTIAVNTGTIGLVSYYIYIIYNVNRFRQNLKYDSTKSIIPYFYILIVYLHASVEASCLTGGVLFGMNTLVASYLAEKNEME